VKVTENERKSTKKCVREKIQNRVNIGTKCNILVPKITVCIYKEVDLELKKRKKKAKFTFLELFLDMKIALVVYGNVYKIRFRIK